MKKNVLLTLIYTLTLLFVPTSTHGQGFLKKMKLKAEKAINKVTGTETPEDEATYDADDDNGTSGKPTATDRLPKLRQSSVVWDGEVQPSRASSVRALLNELPALPTTDELANPTEATRNAYCRRLSALSMRADELDEELSCSDEEMLAARDKLYEELEAVLGLTSEEMKRLEGPDTPEVEKKRLEEKIRQHLLGGADLESISANVQGKEPRMREIEKELQIYEKKEKDGTLTETDRKRMMQLSQEMMGMHQDMMSDLGDLMEAQGKANALNAKVQAEGAALEKRLKVFIDKQAALRKSETGVVKDCGEIADEYEAQLRGIYEQVWIESDADKVHALYDEADALMKSYRTRAAGIYLKGLQLRLDNTRKLMPEAEAIYADMAEGGMIPKCATRRAPLNVVIDCIDLLRKAYADFPQPDVLPCRQRQLSIPLQKDECILFGESSFAGNITGAGSRVQYTASVDTTTLEREFIAGSQLLVYNKAEQSYYKVEGSKRTRLSGDGPFNFYRAPKRDSSVYGDIPLRKGRRKAVFSRDGSLTLHDGTVLYPLAMQQSREWLIFIINSTRNGGFVKCMYKL